MSSSSATNAVPGVERSSLHNLRRSIMWDYFEKVPETASKTVICKICRAQVKRCAENTTPLHKHLRVHHAELYFEAKENGKRNTDDMRIAYEENMRQIMQRAVTAQKVKKGKQVGRSVVWDYFTQVNPGCAKCCFCGIVLKNRGGTTSHLLRHLEKRHPQASLEVMMKKKKVASLAEGISTEEEMQIDQATSDSPAGPCPTETKEYFNKTDETIVETSATTTTSGPHQIPSPDVKSKLMPSASFGKKATFDKVKDKVDKSLIRLISVNLFPPSIVELEEFKEMLKALNGRYELPTKSTVIKTLLPDFAFELKNKLKTDIDSASHFALTVETWKYRHSKSCMTVVAHFISDTWDILSVVLETVNYPEQQPADDMLIREMRRITDEWGIGEKVVTLVSDPSEMLSTAALTMGWEHLFCFGEKLNSVILTALESVPEITKLLKKVNEIVEYFDLNIKASEVLLSVQQQHNLPEKKLKTRLENKWMTLYGMMERMSEQFEAANTVLCYHAKADMCLCDEEVDLVRAVVSILEPFEAVITEISSNKFTCMSKIIPFRTLLQELVHVGTLVDESSDTAALMTTFKDFIVQQMEAQFVNLERNSTLAMCTLLDPRFKHHAFTGRTNVETAKDQLVQEMASIAGSSSNTNESGEDQDACGTTKGIGKGKNVRKVSLWALFDKRVSDAGVTKNVSSEMENESYRYLKEALLSRDEDPLQWWKLNQVQFPHLQVLAKKYLCIPATSVCSSRLFSKKGEDFNTRRNKIKPTDLNTMVFLSSNVKVGE